MELFYKNGAQALTPRAIDLISRLCDAGIILYLPAEDSMIIKNVSLHL